MRASGRPQRRGRGLETPEAAASRGRLDAAIVALAFCAGLRRSESAALVWGDITPTARAMAAERAGAVRPWDLVNPRIQLPDEVVGRSTQQGASLGAEQMAHDGLAQGNRLDGEVGYGLPVGSRFVGTPRGGFSTSEYWPGPSARLRPRRAEPGEPDVRAGGRRAAGTTVRCWAARATGCSGGRPWAGDGRRQGSPQHRPRIAYRYRATAPRAAVAPAE